MEKEREKNVLLPEDATREQDAAVSGEKNALHTERLELESRLSATDFKVIKCAEASLSGLEPPYGIDALRAERKAWRDRINAIDIRLDELDGTVPTGDELLARAKVTKLEQIGEYDISANVNAFTVGGVPMWLNFDLRSRLARSLEVCQAETMTKYFAGAEYTFPVPVWRQMIDAVEAYATQCQTVTESHKAAVQRLASVDEVEAYDFTTGYPEKLAF